MSEQKSYFLSYERTTPILRDTDASSRHGKSENRRGQTIIVLRRIQIFIKRIQIRIFKDQHGNIPLITICLMQIKKDRVKEKNRKETRRIVCRKNVDLFESLMKRTTFRVLYRCGIG